MTWQRWRFQQLAYEGIVYDYNDFGEVTQLWIVSHGYIFEVWY